ncbi:MAG TPA: hypothetical protein VF260_07610 [Bacilli bacterium]
MALTWTYNSSSGYQDPDWRHIDKSTALEMSDFNVADTTETTYNNNIIVYGVWKWGPGNGLGY